MANDWIYSVINKTLEDGGATVTLDGAERGNRFAPTTGYQVAIPGHLLTLPADMPADQMYPRILAHLRSNIMPLRGNSSIALGTWTFDGEIYVEPSETIENRETAIAVGRARAQIAIWDNALGVEISTAGEPEQIEAPAFVPPVGSQNDWQKEDNGAVDDWEQV